MSLALSAAALSFVFAARGFVFPIGSNRRDVRTVGIAADSARFPMSQRGGVARAGDHLG